MIKISMKYFHFYIQTYKIEFCNLNPIEVCGN